MTKLFQFRKQSPGSRNKNFPSHLSSCGNGIHHTFPSLFMMENLLKETVRYANEQSHQNTESSPQAIKGSLKHHNNFTLFSSFTPSYGCFGTQRKLWNFSILIPPASRWRFSKRFPAKVWGWMKTFSSFMDIVLQFKSKKTTMENWYRKP